MLFIRYVNRGERCILIDSGTHLATCDDGAIPGVPSGGRLKGAPAALREFSTLLVELALNLFELHPENLLLVFQESLFPHFSRCQLHVACSRGFLLLPLEHRGHGGLLGFRPALLLASG